MHLSDFVISESAQVEHHADLPSDADLVVIGGGVIGVCTALFAARSGLRAVLVEKGRIAGEQSSRNWGWIRQQGRDPDELPIMVEAAQHWRDLSAQTDVDIGLRHGGVTYIAKNDAKLEAYVAWLPHAHANGIDSRMLSRAEVAAMLPQATRDWPGALYTASDMRAEPLLAVPALARLAAREGVTVIESCAARGIETQAGSVGAVVTERGTIKTGSVVLAGGAWSSLFLRNAGVNLPQLSVRSSVVAVDAAPMAYAGGAALDGVAFRSRLDGGYTLANGNFSEFFLSSDAFRHFTKFWTHLRTDLFGTRILPAAPNGHPDGWTTGRRWTLDQPSPFEAMRVLNPKPNVRILRKVVRDFAVLFPDLGPVRPKATWAGMIDTLPDLVPVVDRVAAIDGMIVATGMSGHGFGIGPAIGRVVADLVTGGDVGHDLTRFRFDRFSDGSPIVLGPAL